MTTCRTGESFPEHILRYVGATDKEFCNAGGENMALSDKSPVIYRWVKWLRINRTPYRTSPIYRRKNSKPWTFVVREGWRIRAEHERLANELRDAGPRT